MVGVDRTVFILSSTDGHLFCFLPLIPLESGFCVHHDPHTPLCPSLHDLVTASILGPHITPSSLLPGSGGAPLGSLPPLWLPLLFSATSQGLGPTALGQLLPAQGFRGHLYVPRTSGVPSPVQTLSRAPRSSPTQTGRLCLDDVPRADSHCPLQTTSSLQCKIWQLLPFPVLRFSLSGPP